jgi:hypothetical protein
MRYFVLLGALALLPLTACSQSAAQAQMTQARSAAHDASFAALSADHRKTVQMIVDAFDNGKVDILAGAQQIDAVLSPAEAQAVLAEQKKMRDSIRAAREQNGDSSGGGNGGGGGGGMNGGGGGGGYGRRAPDAGRFMITVSGSPDKVREAMQQARQQQQDSQGQ